MAGIDLNSLLAYGGGGWMKKRPINNGKKNTTEATGQSTIINPTLLPPCEYGQVNIENMKGKRQGGY